MKIAYLLYPDFTALDLVGPYEVISRWPDAEVHFVARSLDPVRCDHGLTGFQPTLQTPCRTRTSSSCPGVKTRSRC
jgi:putative intracellular protease/amidase